jgi:hypothetical protein
MPVEIPDLWSDDIKVDVLMPLVILRAQDAALGRKTQGALRTEIRSTRLDGYNSEDGTPVEELEHTLVLKAPALQYTEDVLSVQHRDRLGYPATITMPEPIQWRPSTAAAKSATAYSSDELIALLRTALQSRETRALIESLLASVREVTPLT